MALEQYSNLATTTLSGDITSGALTISVASSGQSPFFFPASPQYRIRIDNEFLLVTGVSGLTWGVLRGQENSAATGHTSGVIVKHGATAEGLRNLPISGTQIAYGIVPTSVLGTGSANSSSFLRGDSTWASVSSPSGNITSSDAFGSEPASPSSGDLFFPNNAPIIERFSGAWNYWGPVYPLTAPSSGSFFWINQGTATVALSGGGLFLLAPAVATSLRCLIQTAPTGSYSVECAFIPMFITINSCNMGLLFRESSSSKIVTFNIGWANGPVTNTENWTNATTFSSTNSTPYTLNWAAFFRGIVYLRIRRDVSAATSGLYFDASADGINWTNFKSTTTSQGFTTAPDQVGFYVNSENSLEPAGLHLLHWKTY